MSAYLTVVEIKRNVFRFSRIHFITFYGSAQNPKSYTAFWMIEKFTNIIHVIAEIVIVID